MNEANEVLSSLSDDLDILILSHLNQECKDPSVVFLSEWEEYFVGEWNEAIAPFLRIRNEKKKNYSSEDKLFNIGTAMESRNVSMSCTFNLQKREAFETFKCYLSNQQISLAEKNDYNEITYYEVEVISMRIIELIYLLKDAVSKHNSYTINYNEVENINAELYILLTNYVGMNKRVGKYRITEFAYLIDEKIKDLPYCNPTICAEIAHDLEHLAFRVCTYYGKDYQMLRAMYSKNESKRNDAPIVKTEDEGYLSEDEDFWGQILDLCDDY